MTTKKTKTPPMPVRHDVSLLTDDDLYLFNEGNHYRLYHKLGAHVLKEPEAAGTYFAVWAPDAEQVWVTGDFNGWDKGSHPLSHRAQSGIWEGFIPGLGAGSLYKYHVASKYGAYRVDKADPFAFSCEGPPRTASIVWDLDYAWEDGDWMAGRHRANALDGPHVGLRGAPGLLAAGAGGGRPLPHLPGTGPPPGRARPAPGLHPRGIHAGHGAPLLRLLGLPDHRLLRPHQPLRHPPGFHVSRGLPAPARHRRHPGLGALPLPGGRARPRLLRRHSPL